MDCVFPVRVPVRGLFPESFLLAMSSRMELVPVQSEQDWKAARSVRERVFIDEQECPPEEEWDGHDDTSRHVLGRVEGTVMATARWRAVPREQDIVAKLERFAVLPEYRGQGFGTELVRYVLNDARRAGFDVFVLHAQAQLENWYEELGFQSTGRTFTEANIPHVEMLRRDDAERSGP